MKKLVRYGRYSSNNQREESIDAQMRAMEEYAEKNGFEIVHDYIDEALSGTSDDREQFQQMIKDSASGEWQYVLVHKLDRFARNKYDSAIYKRALKVNGVRVLSVLENLDDSPESVILESVLEGMSEYYSRNLSREVKKGLRENAYQGKLTGGFPPIGYDVDEDGHYVINEEEADSVRLMYKWTLDGIGYVGIAEKLNALGRTTKAGRPFTKNSIYDILRNEKYKGVLVHSKYSRSFDKRWSRHNAKNEDALYLPNMVPPIIDLQTWTEVNEGLDQRANRGKAHGKHVYLLSGIIFCGNCGSVLEGGRERTNYYYRCAAKAQKRSQCTSSRVDADQIEARVIDLLRRELLNEKSIKKILPKLAKEAVKRATESVQDLAVLQERMTEIDEQSTRLVEAIMEMGSSNTIRAKLKALEDEKAQIVKTIVMAETEARIYTTNQDEIADVLYGDLENFNTNESASMSKAFHRYVQKVVITFDPNDPPKPGHKRQYTLDIEAVIRPNTGGEMAPPRGLEPLFSP